MMQRRTLPGQPLNKKNFPWRDAEVKKIDLRRRERRPLSTRGGLIDKRWRQYVCWRYKRLSDV